ncbi:MAG: serine/threonine protein kinase [Acidimicrobiia bacterium]
MTVGAWPASVDVEIDGFAPRVGSVFMSLHMQDSRCHAYGVEAAGQRWFLKGSLEARAVPSLERAVAVHRRVAHPSIIPLEHVVRTPGGLVLVYPWIDGEVLYGVPNGGVAARRGRGSPHERFRALSLAEVLVAFDALLDAHVAIAGAGFVAVDLYDGCFIYDFVARRMWICDLDEYRPGPFVVEGERLPGSTRFMAPEEWVEGATIDERTTVFNLGRTGLVLLDEGPDAPVEVGDSFRGTGAMADVLIHATQLDPEDRHESVAELADAWARVTRRGAE